MMRSCCGERACFSWLVYCLLQITVAGPELRAGGLPARVEQLVVVTAENWESGRGRMQWFWRNAGEWIPVLDEQRPVLLGKSGLAWGKGLLPEALPAGARFKVEGDGRSPAGVFAIGRVFGYAPDPPPGTRLAYRQVTEWDCWVEDGSNPLYNRHVVIDPSRGVPVWYAKERMRSGDHAHSLKLEIRHNADPPQPGMGSAIFFHIRRGPDRSTAGCTTMKEEDLVALVRWLDPRALPHLVLLPRADYQALKAAWGLP